MKQTKTRGRKIVSKRAVPKGRAAATTPPTAPIRLGRSHEMPKRLRMIREEKKLSQDKVGRAVGLSRGAITQWEGGQTQPSLDMIERLAAFLSTSPEFIAFGVESKKRNEDWIAVPVVEYTGRGEVRVKSHMQLEAAFMNQIGINGHPALKAFAVMDSGIIPNIKKGDRAVIDESDKHISTKTPVAIMANGEPKLAVATIIPSGGGGGSQRVRLSMSEEVFEQPLSEINVLGRLVTTIRQEA